MIAGMSGIENKEMEHIGNDFHHSTFYHHYFEGYIETKVKKKNKKRLSIIRVYGSDYIQQAVNTKTWWSLKISFLLFVIIHIGIFFYAASLKIPCNMQSYTSLAVAVVVLSDLAVFCFTGFRLGTHRKMTRWEYKVSEEYFMTACKINLIGQISTIFCVLVYLCIDGKQIVQSAVGVILYCLSFCIMLILFVLGRSIHYELVENDNEILQEGNQIW